MADASKNPPSEAGGKKRPKFPSGKGDGLLEFVRVDSKTVMTRKRATYPLKLLAVPNLPTNATHTDAAWVYMIGHGGGQFRPSAYALAVRCTVLTKRAPVQGWGRRHGGPDDTVLHQSVSLQRRRLCIPGQLAISARAALCSALTKRRVCKRKSGTTRCWCCSWTRWCPSLPRATSSGRSFGSRLQHREHLVKKTSSLNAAACCAGQARTGSRRAAWWSWTG
eukprot:3622120-Rhodomonas_salina.1